MGDVQILEVMLQVIATAHQTRSMTQEEKVRYTHARYGIYNGTKYLALADDLNRLIRLDRH